MIRPRVLLDVDGVLADFVGAVLAVLRTMDVVVVDRAAITHFDIGASLGLDPVVWSNAKRAIGNTAQFARHLAVYPGAREGVAALQAFCDVFIVTSPWNSNATWCHDREAWLRRHFDIPHAYVVHTSAKYLCVGDVFVDDKTSALVHWQSAHPMGLAVQWATPHNRQDAWTGPSTSDWVRLREWVEAVAVGKSVHWEPR